MFRLEGIPSPLPTGKSRKIRANRPRLWSFPPSLTTWHEDCNKKPDILLARGTCLAQGEYSGDSERRTMRCCQ